MYLFKSLHISVFGSFCSWSRKKFHSGLLQQTTEFPWIKSEQSYKIFFMITSKVYFRNFDWNFWYTVPNGLTVKNILYFEVCFFSLKLPDFTFCCTSFSHAEELIINVLDVIARGVTFWLLFWYLFSILISMSCFILHLWIPASLCHLQNLSVGFAVFSTG